MGKNSLKLRMTSKEAKIYSLSKGRKGPSVKGGEGPE
jgi:hypothetical protein